MAKDIEVTLVFKDDSINSHKYYHMSMNKGDEEFTVKYGRVGSGGTKVTYSASLWEKKKREKLKKGYRLIKEVVLEDSLLKIIEKELGL